MFTYNSYVTNIERNGVEKKAVTINFKFVKDKEGEKNKRIPIHNIHIIDRSSSMYDNINSLIDKIEKSIDAMEDEDIVSILWFSGKGEYGTIIKGATKNTNIKKVLDNYRSTVGLTCFSEVLEEAEKVVKDLAPLCSNCNISFFTDGCIVTEDNIKETEKVYDIIKRMKDNIISFNTIGFGNYCDEKMLKSMSEISNYGKYTFSDNIHDYKKIWFDNYMIVNNLNDNFLEFKISKKLLEEPEVIYINNKTSIYHKGFDFKIDHVDNIKNQITVILSKSDFYDLVDESSSVNLFYFEFKDKDLELPYIIEPYKNTPKNIKNIIYHALMYHSYYNSDIFEALSIAKHIGNKYFLKKITESFTHKEKQVCLNEMFHSISSTFGKGPKFKGEITENVSFESIIEDSVCFFDILDFIEKHVDNVDYVVSKEYRRIGVKYKDNFNMFNYDKNKEIITSFKNLVLNSTRANISIRYAIDGNVSINPKQAKKVGLDKEINCKIYRNQNIIKDGKYNIDKMVLKVKDPATIIDFMSIFNKGYNTIFGNTEKRKDNPYEIEGDKITINLKSIPILNFEKIKDFKDIEFLKKMVYKNTIYKSCIKTIKWYIKNNYLDYKEKELYSESINFNINDDQLKLLKEYGIDSNLVYNGIERVKDEKSITDKYETRELNFYIEGCSSIAKVEPVVEKDKKWKEEQFKKQENMDYEMNLKGIKYSKTEVFISTMLNVIDEKINNEKLNREELYKWVIDKKYEYEILSKKIEESLFILKFFMLTIGYWYNELEYDEKKDIYKYNDLRVKVKRVMQEFSLD